MAVLNIIGLCLNTLGALLIFFYSPNIDYNTYLYRHTEKPNLNKKANRKNNLARMGALLLVVGFLMQLIAIVYK